MTRGDLVDEYIGVIHDFHRWKSRADMLTQMMRAICREKINKCVYCKQNPYNCGKGNQQSRGCPSWDFDEGLLSEDIRENALKKADDQAV